MKLPEEFLHSLQGLPGFNREHFTAVHESGESITSIRINAAKWPGVASVSSDVDAPATTTANLLQSQQKQVPWCGSGYYLPVRPSFTFDPFFHAGRYYVQEASSMFLEQALVQCLDLAQPLKVLDLCAAPGGKSTHIQSLISPQSLLVSNEVIRARNGVLTDNIVKWGAENVIVTNNDPKAFQQLNSYFDVMIVDAPCSGSGLFRKDGDAIAEWSLNNVALCSGRQQRILADALPALKPGGLLVYATCSYSAEEDEAIMDWLVSGQAVETRPLAMQQEWGNIVETISVKTGAAGYRFYPDKIKGEGFFMACFTKSGGDVARLRAAKPNKATGNEQAVVSDWLVKQPALLNYRDGLIALPELLLPLFLELQATLNIQYAGVAIGKVLKNKLVPHHALAQSNLLRNDVAAVEANYGQAIKYLQRNDVGIEPQFAGWQVVKYKNASLGWVNALPNRINNYYPKEIRILKAQNDHHFKK